MPGRLWSSISAPYALVASPSAVVPRNASSHGHLSQGGRTTALETTSVTFRIWCAATFFQTISVFFIKHTHIQAYAHAHTCIPQKATGQEIQINRYLGTGATQVRWPGTHVTATRPWPSTFLATGCEDRAQDGFQAGLSRSSGFPGATRAAGSPPASAQRQQLGEPDHMMSLSSGSHETARSSDLQRQQEGVENMENFTQGKASGSGDAVEGPKNPSELPNQSPRQSS